MGRCGLPFRLDCVTYEVTKWGSMRIEFENRKLERTFNVRSKLVQAYGERQAQKIGLRMAVLNNASCLADVPAVPPDRRHQLSSNRDGQFAVDLDHPYRLVFAVADQPVPLLPDGGIDLAAVTAIRIIQVVDYHGR